MNINYHQSLADMNGALVIFINQHINDNPNIKQHE
jgi:hypothetical protein